MKMKLFAAALAAAVSGPVLAADLPYTKGPALYTPPPVPVITWTGFYLGVNVGYSYETNNSVTVSTLPGFINAGFLAPVGIQHANDAANGANGAVSPPRSNIIGGGQAGYNFQAGSFVWGFEADFQGLISSGVTVSTSNLASLTGETPVGTTLSAQRRMVDFGTARARVGYLVMPTLLAYATGGFAYGQTKLGVGITGVELPFAGTTILPVNASYSSTRVGWTAGGGLEWMFLPNWSVKAEALYYDLGRTTIALPPYVGNVGGPTAFTHYPVVTTHYNGVDVRFGLNYHFDFWSPPAAVVAKY